MKESAHSSSNITEKSTVGKLRNVIIVFFSALSIVVLYFLSLYNYLFFHVLIEVFSIVVSFAIFALAWNTRRFMDNYYLSFIGIALLFVGALGLFHALGYNGMGVFPGYGTNLATQFWIAMRYMLSIAFLAGTVFVKKRFHVGLTFFGFAFATGLIIASIFYWENFPVMFIDGPGGGLTPFKIASEYIIVLILSFSLFLLFYRRSQFGGNIIKFVGVAIVSIILAELSFTLYTDAFGLANMTGHLLTLIGFYFVYKALLENGLNKPFDLLFHNLKQSEVRLASHASKLEEYNEKLVNEINERKKIEDDLRDSEERLRLKLDSVLSPNVDIGEQELSNIIDVPALQEMMDDLYAVTKIGFTVLDLKGNVLVANGWQDICTNFHRANPRTAKNCIESDTQLSKGLPQGKFKAYRCKNNMWDIVTPIFIGGKHVGNVFSGQFFFEDEKLDRNLFLAQAKKYGFDKERYLEAFDNVPRWSREKVENLMMFFTQLSDMISRLGYSNLKLAKSLTDQKIIETSLREHRSWLEGVFASMNDGVVILDAVGNVVSFNLAFANFYRFRNKEDCLRNINNFSNILEYYTFENKLVSVDKWPSIRAVQGEKGFNEEFFVRRKDLNESWVGNFSYAPVLNDSGAVVGAVCAMRDVTNKKEMQDKLQEYATQMEELAANRAEQLKDAQRLATIGETAGMVGHDIRNPLQAIVGELYLARDEVKSLDESEAKKNLMESIDEIENRLIYVNKIVSDLQDFARNANPKYENINLNSLIDEVLSTVTVPDNIKVNRSNSSVVESFESDPTFLKRILSNLVTNAIQAMPNGGGLMIFYAIKANKMLISVADTGGGIPSEVKDKLFKPLMTTKSQGQGFGLAVVKKLTEALGGTVRFESQLGKGTQFTVEIPCRSFRKSNKYD